MLTSKDSFIITVFAYDVGEPCQLRHDWCVYSSLFNSINSNADEHATQCICLAERCNNSILLLFEKLVSGSVGPGLDISLYIGFQVQTLENSFFLFSMIVFNAVIVVISAYTVFMINLPLILLEFGNDIFGVINMDIYAFNRCQCEYSPGGSIIAESLCELFHSLNLKVNK